MKLSIITKTIGKRGWLGIICFALGLLTFLTAGQRSEFDAEPNLSLDERIYRNAVAEGAGYKSFDDAYSEYNKHSGTTFIIIGSALMFWGYKRYNGKKPESEKPQNNQTDKTTMPVVISGNKQTSETLDKRAVTKSVLKEFLVSSPLVKTLLIWFCRIFGPLGCVAAIGMIMKATSGKASQDDMGLNGSILVFLVFAIITSCGFGKRKKNAV